MDDLHAKKKRSITFRRDLMRAVKIEMCLFVVLAGVLFFVYNDPGALASDTENFCFTCHTNARKLIKITREISKANKGIPGGSMQTSGEG
jgi:nitrate/TMAO reductase-like tetraheme cytochrome c subunit